MWIIAQAARVGVSVGARGGIATVARHGASYLTLDFIVEQLDDYFNNGPGAGIPAEEATRMKESTFWLLEQIPDQFKGPWTNKKTGAEMPAEYLHMRLADNQVWLSPSYTSKKSLNRAFNRGKSRGWRSRGNQLEKQTTILKGVN